MNLTAYLPPAPRLKMSGAVPLLPPYAFMVWRKITLPFSPFTLIVSFIVIKLFNFIFVYFMGFSYQLPLEVHARVVQVSCVERVLILTDFY